MRRRLDVLGVFLLTAGLTLVTVSGLCAVVIGR